MKDAFDRLLIRIGVSGSDPGSRWRNFVSYSALVLSIILIAAGLLGPQNRTLGFSAIALCLLAVWLFYQVVVVALFKISESFAINPVRLIRDILISGWYSICTFGFLYRQWGIVGPDQQNLPEPLDHYYFSAVTFSTLGYGDFRPSETMRVPAALEAIFGNLHLGLLAGGVFLLISVFSTRKAISKSDKKADKQQADSDYGSDD